MKTLGTILIMSLFVPAAFARIDPRAPVTSVRDSSFHRTKPVPPEQFHPRWRVERDGVVSGNVKCSIMIVPVNPMIDPGMIKMIPCRKPIDKMPAVPRILR